MIFQLCFGMRYIPLFCLIFGWLYYSLAILRVTARHYFWGQNEIYDFSFSFSNWHIGRLYYSIYRILFVFWRRLPSNILLNVWIWMPTSPVMWKQLRIFLLLCNLGKSHCKLLPLSDVHFLSLKQILFIVLKQQFIMASSSLEFQNPLA